MSKLSCPRSTTERDAGSFALRYGLGALDGRRDDKPKVVDPLRVPGVDAQEEAGEPIEKKGSSAARRASRDRCPNVSSHRSKDIAEVWKETRANLPRTRRIRQRQPTLCKHV
jgi:hypothetical protein